MACANCGINIFPYSPLIDGGLTFCSESCKELLIRDQKCGDCGRAMLIRCFRAKTEFTSKGRIRIPICADCSNDFAASNSSLLGRHSTLARAADT